jgi:hypothetical protein
MSKSTYPQVENGGWVNVPAGHTLKLACCDCSLVHRIKFRKRDGALQLQFVRDERATAAIRRKK